MRTVFLLFLCLLSVTAFAQKTDLMVDYEYSCQKFMKLGGSNDFVQIETYGTDYLLRVGQKQSAGFFGFGGGGPWMSLEEVNTDQIMIFGVSDCLKKVYAHGNISLNLDCVDKLSYNDEGLGYYTGDSWMAYHQVGNLPGLHNWNLTLSKGFWDGDDEGRMTTTTLAGYDASEENITRSRYECRRLSN